MQADADARAARPVFCRFANLGEGDIHILMTEMARDVRQPRAEQKCVHPVPVVGHGMHEVQQHPGITAHGA